MRMLTVNEMDVVNGVVVPIAANIAIRTGVGGLISGTAAYGVAMADGKMTEAEAKAVLVAVCAGALTGAAGGIYKALGM